MMKRIYRARYSACGFALVATMAALLTGCSISEPPELPPKDYDRSATWQAHMVSCLQDEGWDVVATDDGALNFASGGIDDSQFEPYSASVDKCELASGLPTWDDLSEGQRRGNYQLMTEAAKCLRDQGYDIPVDPSFQQYEDDNASWTPFAELGLSGEKLDELEKICPQPTGW